ncbi:MAG: DUF2752 domain-containing protein [Oscillospiraceae bacterium]|nr:DUF2752 domain-containing protein [Oscillospiraceae bacterium]
MEKKGWLLWLSKRLALTVAVAAACFVLFGVIGRQCLFLQVTGLPCLTCGMGRAWLSALQLDFARAFFWHPLFWALPLLALALIFFGTGRRWVRRGLATFFVLLAAVYLVRMVLFFPYTSPMAFDPDAFLPRLFGWHF